MAETRKSGKTALRPVDGRQAAGMCHYSIGSRGSEFLISAQLPGTAEVRAVLQYGPERGYLCRPPEPVSGPMKCPDGAVAAVWVLAGGNPVLFGRIGTGLYDQTEARRHLLENKTKPQKSSAQSKPVALPLPPVPAMAPKPTFREPSSRSEQPFPLPEQKPGAAAAIERASPVSAATVSDAAAHTPPASAARAAEPAAPAQPGPGSAGKPLTVKRAPRPTPHPAVYSPLWDDVAAEFEKMLEDLPRAQPFNGSTLDAQIVEVPIDGAVQCYVGVVTVQGMKVFLQAVPARPYGRPAGFDHSLVSRDGECYWVKYFIQSENT